MFFVYKISKKNNECNNVVEISEFLINTTVICIKNYLDSLTFSSNFNIYT